MAQDREHQIPLKRYFNLNIKVSRTQIILERASPRVTTKSNCEDNDCTVPLMISVLQWPQHQNSCQYASNPVRLDVLT